MVVQWHTDEALQPLSVTIRPLEGLDGAATGPATSGRRPAARPPVRNAWLRRPDNSVVPLLPARPGGASDLACRFSGAVTPGSYLLCASVADRGVRFPSRPVHVEREPTDLAFEVMPAGRPYFRLGQRVIGYHAGHQRLGAVLLDGDVDEGAVGRLGTVLAGYGYERVIDLTRVQVAAWRQALPGDALVLEFRPAAHAHQPAADAGRLVRDTRAIARRAGLATPMIRLGRLMHCEAGRLVLDNEVVLGFADDVERADAQQLVGRAGGRVLEDLSDHDDHSPILVARFEGMDPEAALALTEAWLDGGVLHWAEPNVVEH
jgi:hypothetical protein